MKMYVGSINDRVWKVTENDFVILDPVNPTDNEREASNTILWLSTQSIMALIQRYLTSQRS